MTDRRVLHRRYRPPSWVKFWAVPAWNFAIHRSSHLGDVIGAICRQRIQRCEVCGRIGLMIYRWRVIPTELARRWGLTERLTQAVARKESTECSHCGAKLRGRRIAHVLLECYPFGQPARSLAEWVKTPEANLLRVAEINRVEGLHPVLANLSRFEASDFVDGAEPGGIIDGVRHEDLTRLTYPDASFDLVITSETLEHVPDLNQALNEIRRILVSGGRHVFTVPLLPGIPRTFPRATLNDAGEMINLAPPIFHPGGNVGYPVFTEFGADFPDLVRGAGFAVEVWFGPATEDDVAQVYVARKGVEHEDHSR